MMESWPSLEVRVSQTQEAGGRHALGEPRNAKVLTEGKRHKGSNAEQFWMVKVQGCKPGFSEPLQVD